MGQMFRRGPARAGEGWDPAGVPPWQAPWWEETAENCSITCLDLEDTGHYDQDSGAWAARNQVRGPLLLPASCLPASCFWLGLPHLWAQMYGNLGSLSSLPRECKPSCPLRLLSSHRPLEEGWRMELTAMGHECQAL